MVNASSLQSEPSYALLRDQFIPAGHMVGMWLNDDVISSSAASGNSSESNSIVARIQSDFKLINRYFKTEAVYLSRADYQRYSYMVSYSTEMYKFLDSIEKVGYKAVPNVFGVDRKSLSGGLWYVMLFANTDKYRASIVFNLTTGLYDCDITNGTDATIRECTAVLNKRLGFSNTFNTTTPESLEVVDLTLKVSAYFKRITAETTVDNSTVVTNTVVGGATDSSDAVSVYYSVPFLTFLAFLCMCF